MKICILYSNNYNPNNNEDLNKEIKSTKKMYAIQWVYIRYAEESKYVKNPSKSEAKLIQNNTTYLENINLLNK